MSRPRVIKDKGVAVVEGTPASSLIKDSGEFFKADPPDRMAGESISQPRRLTQFTKEEIAEKRGEIFNRLKDVRRQVTPGGESRERIKAEREEVSKKYGTGKLSAEVMDQVRAEYGYFPGSSDDPRMGGKGQYLKSEEERNAILETYRIENPRPEKGRGGRRRIRKTEPTGGRRGRGHSCPDPSMHISMADGSQKKAGELVIGDLVSTNHEIGLDLGDFEVEYVEIVKNIEKIKLIFDESEIICSLTHKFYVNNSWKEAKDMIIGDEVSGKKLISIDDVEDGDVVHITVKDAHTYICEGLLSHNKRYATKARPKSTDEEKDPEQMKGIDKAEEGSSSTSPTLTREEADRAREEFIERRRNKAKERANRFKRRRSSMQRERSTEEQQATEGKFISTIRS